MNEQFTRVKQYVDSSPESLRAEFSAAGTGGEQYGGNLLGGDGMSLVRPMDSNIYDLTDGMSKY